MPRDVIKVTNESADFSRNNHYFKTDPNPTISVTFLTIQHCIIDYIFGVSTDSNLELNIKNSIGQFNEDARLMEFLLKLDFDPILPKIHILWQIYYVSRVTLSADVVASLNLITYPSFNQDDLNSWL